MLDMSSVLAPDNKPRKLDIAIIIAGVGWIAGAMMAWGSISSQVSDHHRRLDKLESSSLSDRDLVTINARLVRIENQLDELLKRPR